MKTRLKRTREITTRDVIVTGGEDNPIPGDTGARRRAWKCVEVAHTGIGGSAAATTARAVLVELTRAAPPDPPYKRVDGTDFLMIGPLAHTTVPKVRVLS